MLATSEYFDFAHDPFGRKLFSHFESAWSIVAAISEIVAELTIAPRILGTVAESAILDGKAIHIETGATVEAGAYIKGPAYIGPGVTIRHGAYVRENCIFLDGSVVGHGTEVKNSVLMSNANAAHYAYVGDSLLGHRVNLGAGTILSNLPLPISTAKSGLVLIAGTDRHPTALKKLGAIIGDDSKLGARVVTNPGTLLQPDCIVYPGVIVPRGTYARYTMIKTPPGNSVQLERRRIALE